MTLEKFISEAARLARPCLHLTEGNSEKDVVAIWGGQGRAGRQGREGDKHRITFDCGWLAVHGFRVRGSIGVYDVDPRWRWPIPLDVERNVERIAKLRIRDGLKLYGQEAPSYPPLEALCLYGGPIVAEWLASEGLDRTDYDAASTSRIGQAYQAEYQKRCPLYLDIPPVAVLGGWHAYWPSDEFYLPREMRLLLWTFRESEPWVEVFERFPNLPVRLRGF
jgi:hypothetical protein